MIRGGEGLSRADGRGDVKDPDVKYRRVFKPCPLEAVTREKLQEELLGPLTGAGLSKAEAEALLSIWIPELAKPGTRLVYILPRAEYDRLLPIRFSPQPEELVRVGLVVQEISP